MCVIVHAWFIVSIFCMTFYLQTSHHLAFTLYLLALNKDKQDILYKEIKDNIKHNDQPTDSEVSSLSYLKAVFKESHR